MPAQQFSVTQTAEYFGVSTRTVHRWISSGELPATRCGPRLIRINADALADFGRKLA